MQPPPVPPSLPPGAKENQNPQKQKVALCSSSLLRDLPGFAVRGNRPGEKGTARLPACLAPSGIFNIALSADRLLMYVLSGDFAIKSFFSSRLGSEPRVKLTREVRPRQGDGGESSVSKVNYFRRPNERPGKEGDWGGKPVDGWTDGTTKPHTCPSPASSLDAE